MKNIQNYFKTELLKQLPTFKESDIEIISFLDGFKDKNIDDILSNISFDYFHQNNDFITKFYDFILKKTHFLMKYQTETIIISDEIKISCSIINTSLKIFYDGLTENSLLKIIYSSLIFNHFDLALPKLIDDQICNKEGQISITNKIESILLHLKCNVSIPENAQYSDKKFYEIYNTGRNENNLYKIYEFIDAIERGGHLFPNVLINILTCVLLHFNLEKFVNVINNKNDPFEIKIILSQITIDKIISICSNYTIINLIVLIEMLDLSTELMPENTEDKDLKTISQLIKSMFEIKRDISAFLFHKFRNNKNFNKIFGLFLGINFNYSKEFLTTIEFTRYSFNMENYRLLLEYFSKDSSESNQYILFSDIYNKYSKYIEFAILDDDYYLNDIYISDYIYFVLSYYLCTYKTETILNKKINEGFLKLNTISRLWHKNFTNYQRVYFIYLTELFLLSCIYIQNNFSIDVDITSLYDEKYWLIFFNTKIPERIQKIITNYKDKLK